jgi:hypothetical protein
MLEQKGEDLSRVPPKLRRVALDIAHERLDPEAYRLFEGTAVLQYLRALPLTEQQRLAEGGTVKVYTFDNGKAQREVPVLSLTGFEISQVFDTESGIRNAAAQRSWLESRHKRQRHIDGGPIELITDKRRHTLVIRAGSESRELSASELGRLVAEVMG